MRKEHESTQYMWLTGAESHWGTLGARVECTLQWHLGVYW